MKGAGPWKLRTLRPRRVSSLSRKEEGVKCENGVKYNRIVAELLGTARD